MNFKIKTTAFLLLTFLNYSCSKDNTEEFVVPEKKETVVSVPACNPDYYVEKNGLLVVEFESVFNKNSWVLGNTIEGHAGTGYLTWTINENFGTPGSGTLTYPIKITKTGTYRFIWKSRITKGTSGTEHNDSWLRFIDASDFYGKKGDHIVYPGGLGKTPVPAGSSSSGWFKIYMNGLNNWVWISSTSDHDAHEIFVKFDTPGIYKMEVSARSSYHSLDRFVMYTEGVARDLAIGDSTPASEIVCKK